MQIVKTFTVFGEQVDILLAGEQSDGTCAALIQTVPPGGGPPPHVHDLEDETFQALDSGLELLLDGQWTPVQPGETRFCSRGTPHTFRNAGSTAARMLVLVSPAGLDRYLEEIGPLSPAADMPEIVRISDSYGIRFLL